MLGSIAHARMLGRQGIIPAPDSALLVDGLAALLARAATARRRVRGRPQPGRGDADRADRRSRPAVCTPRAAATTRSPPTRACLLRAALVEGVAGIVELQSALIEAAEQHGQAVMPGYTHLQRAQPVLLGHHLLAYAEMLERDAGRLRDAYVQRRRAAARGGCAGRHAVSARPRVRRPTARVLRRSAATASTRSADRDFLAEHLSALAIVAMHLSRLAEELVLWSTAEFGFVALDESFTTGSSIMPQKRNPDVAELLRGKTGRVYGVAGRVAGHAQGPADELQPRPAGGQRRRTSKRST